MMEFGLATGRSSSCFRLDIDCFIVTRRKKVMTDARNADKCLLLSGCVCARML